MATIAVIGAGLAGLNAARLLTGRGHDVQLLEAADRVGGRVTTDTVEGFLCDRGFQLLNPAYPAARRALEYTSLDLHPYGRGVAVRSAAGLQILADPSAWRLLVRHDVPHALPSILPGVTALVSDHPSLAVATDSGDASIQGALAAGENAARAVGTERT